MRKKLRKMQGDRWPDNPLVYVKKTVWMQRISDNVAKGADRYIAGQTDPEKVPALVAKFDQRYVLNKPHSTMSLRRQQGRTTAYWRGWYNERDDLVHWVLLAKTQEEDGEHWRDPTKDWIRVPIGMELVRLPRPVYEGGKGRAGPSWTWRYTREQYEELREQMIDLVRGRDNFHLRQWIYNTHRTPGFAGARVQVKQLWKLLRGEWERSRGSSEALPEIPKTLGYVGRLANKGLSWSELMRERDRKRKQNAG